ncbi:23S rRNA (cytosine1962-C5)-methyltransferase [Arboricoccus pini]|uniref:23S rRNA (Cytosine1962-C5)-methyltransferase n=1 Tax=Arboricoccus pini TaxID=1963835 RepID=A0A212Q1D0_9PROT|nr:class I SAM-dependent rRNA methyltransferase [Arboricoccus pini]SNB53145.1 23S rRNA (cytosine1962-C5)-methyltransferase [Arboricoccus pini]
MSYPVIRINEGHDRRLRNGSPWLYSNELQIDKAAKALPPGSVVRLASHDGRALALAHFNPHSLIAARILTRNTDGLIDQDFLLRRCRRALELRELLYATPHYRLVHGEADGLPGLVIDRFGDTLVVQLNSAGMDGLAAEIIGALSELLGSVDIHLRKDAPVRLLEGLTQEEEPVAEMSAALSTIENGLSFAIDTAGGQKTGWYFDQRENRAFAASLAKDASVLDLYSYAGGFGLTALASGARELVCVDRSEAALALATASAALQGVEAKMQVRVSDAFAALDELAAEKRRFGLVLADPPPFARSRKDLPQALKAYRKVARGSALLVAPGAFLCLSCCSHNVPEEDFARECYAGIRSAGRSGTLIRSAGAAADHPIHPALPESAYLKFLAYRLD